MSPNLRLFKIRIFLVRIKFVGDAPVAVNFITDSYGTARGYQASFRMLACEATTTAPPYTTPPAVTCDRTFNERYGYITSVNYPLPYLRNLDCVYTIEKYSVVSWSKRKQQKRLEN